MTEDPTQRIQRPAEREGYAGDAPTTAMPRPLNLAGSVDAGEPADSSATDVLSLDELLGPPVPSAPEPDPEPAPTAPTWTAMPVVTVRSEPMTAPVAAAPASPASAHPPRAAAHPPIADRMRTDAAAAWDGAVRRTRAWLGRDDNALMLLTALVAVVLILAVAAFAR